MMKNTSKCGRAVVPDSWTRTLIRWFNDDMCGSHAGKEVEREGACIRRWLRINGCRARRRISRRYGGGARCWVAPKNWQLVFAQRERVWRTLEGMITVINTSGSWYLHNRKGVKVTGSNAHSDKHIPRNKTLLIGGVLPPPAAVAQHREMSQNQNKLWYHVKYVKSVKTLVSIMRSHTLYL